MNRRMGCLLVILVLIFNASVGAWSIIEILSWFGNSIPLWCSVSIGFFTAEFSVPIAIVGYILKLIGLF